MVMKEWHMVTGVPNESGEGEGEPSGSAAPNEGSEEEEGVWEDLGSQ